MEICRKMQGVQIRNSVTMNRVGIGWEVGGRFKREGTYVYLWLIHVDVWQKPTQFCKAMILQLKNKKFKIERKEKKEMLIQMLD